MIDHHGDKPPLVVVNTIRFQLAILLMFLCFPRCHAFRDVKPNMVRDATSFCLGEPNENEKEEAMGFCSAKIYNVKSFWKWMEMHIEASYEF